MSRRERRRKNVWGEGIHEISMCFPLIICGCSLSSSQHLQMDHLYQLFFTSFFQSCIPRADENLSQCVLLCTTGVFMHSLNRLYKGLVSTHHNLVQCSLLTHSPTHMHMLQRQESVWSHTCKTTSHKVS